MEENHADQTRTWPNLQVKCHLSPHRYHCCYPFRLHDADHVVFSKQYGFTSHVNG